VSKVKLTLILSGRTIQRSEFDEFTTLKVGRNQDCDVMIDNLGVSRYHCEIVRKGDLCQVKDLNSGNGTYVNGSRITGVHNLNAGDMISIGKFSLRYETDEPIQEEEGPGLERSGDMAKDGMRTLQIDSAALAKRNRGLMSRNRGYLRIGSKEVVLDKALFTFGKESDADVQLKGWFCPRIVAIVIRDESGFRLVDVSPNGQSVYVNGIRKRDTWLNDNDSVVIRGKEMKFLRGVPLGQQ
jgi:pSer/pThr/pTyr-binding forkhead associated (FHA) protein